MSKMEIILMTCIYKIKEIVNYLRNINIFTQHMIMIFLIILI